MRRPLHRVAAADVDQMLYHHGLVARGRPKDSRRKPRRLGEGRDQIAFKHFRRFNRRDGHDVVVGGAKQHAAQAKEITWDLEIDDLAGSVAQEFVGTRPALRQNIGRPFGLPLMHQIEFSRKTAAAFVQCRQNREFRIGQGDISAQLLCKGAVLDI